jgi:hypothetical protein
MWNNEERLTCVNGGASWGPATVKADFGTWEDQWATLGISHGQVLTLTQKEKLEEFRSGYMGDFSGIQFNAEEGRVTPELLALWAELARIVQKTEKSCKQATQDEHYRRFGIRI